MIFFENILDELSAKILVVDDNLDILFLNKSAEDYLCTSLEEVKDKNIDLVFKEKISNELELQEVLEQKKSLKSCLLYTSPSPRDGLLSRMPSSA